MEQLFRFFSPEAGQRRRTALEQLISGVEQFIPPNLRPAAEAVVQMNPVQGISDAMSASGVVFDPAQTAEARRRAAVDMGVEMAMTLAPAALVRMGYLAAPAGLLETFATPSVDAAIDMGQGLLSDATYAARSVGEGDFAGVLDVFRPSGEAQSLSAGASDAPPTMRVFHGTPHDFPAVRLIEMPDGTQLYQNMDELTETPAGARVIEEYPIGRFDLSKIGTGEGAQVYGHGLYFAEAEPVAKSYREQIVGGNTKAARRTLESADGDIDKAISKTEEALRRLDERAAVGDYGNDERRFAAQRQIQIDKLAQLKHYKETGQFDKGRVYEVEIQGSPEQFLDWDKPLSEQPSIARLMGYDDPDAIAAAKAQEYAKFRVPKNDTFEELFAPLNEQEKLATESLASMPISWGSMTGKDAYEAMKDKLGALDWPATADADTRRRYGKEAASKASSAMREAGILGIKYFDQMSRGAGKGSRNYVVFDDRLIEIVRKYGIAGAAALLGVSSADIEGALAQGMPAQPQTGLLQ